MEYGQQIKTTTNDLNMSKYVLSRYNHDISWLKDYTDDYILYDRSVEPLKGSIIMPNIGSDWYDKLSYIIDNYNNLPNTIILIKANLFKYISKEEFDEVRENQIFTPLLTKHHKTYIPTCFYSDDGMYNELNDLWYLGSHPCKHNPWELMKLLGIDESFYVKFAPGSNYIVTKEVIHKYPVDFYVKIRSYLDWDIYPGEAQIIERGIYNVWQR